MITGYLPARAGVDVAVLEKHADFNLDFHGDTNDVSSSSTRRVVRSEVVVWWAASRLRPDENSSTSCCFGVYHEPMASRSLLMLLFFVVPALLAATPPSHSIISRIPRTQVDSTVITSIGYSKRQHALEIEFRNGAIYRYLDVPPQTYRDLIAAPSKASYYDSNIRYRYHSTHVKPRR